MGILFSQPNKYINGLKNPNWKGGKIKRKCKCGKFFFVFPCKIRDNRGKYCSRKCVGKFVYSIIAKRIGKANLGKKHPGNGLRSWYINQHKYKMIYQPYHPYSQKNGYIAEHRLIMERHLRRFLKPEERIHHKNCDRSDNRIENLQLCKNMSEHAKIHLFGEIN